MQIFDRILAARGLSRKTMGAFLLPDYNSRHDPFLLPDMDAAVKRLILAHKNNEKIVVYGDYDIDGLTATALILDAFKSFGFNNVRSIIPSRFVDGYGLTESAIDDIAKCGDSLILTVDCGSLSNKEITKANKLGIDVIVTDHHNAALIQPPAIAVVNPKRADSKYPFLELAGVGVAFKLVQALQMQLPGLPTGTEKWLLDLVALGTVCDIVPLVDENRIYAFWGLKVLAKHRRVGLAALLKVSRSNINQITAKTLGFVLGPRMNAAGRLETAQHSLDLLTASDRALALELAHYLDELNSQRRQEQSIILKEATKQAENYSSDDVLVLSGPSWNCGIVGIVASKILEKYHKPAFVLQEDGAEAHGSARSFGDFNVADAVRSCKDVIISGGGHNLAAGVTLPTENIDIFRKRINEFYKSLKLNNQESLLLPHEDTVAYLNEINEGLFELIGQLEPFGNGNPQPILKTENLVVKNVRKMGDEEQHVKMSLVDTTSGIEMQFLAFNAHDHLFVKAGDKINVWYYIDINEWQGKRSVEGRLLHLEVAAK